MEQFIICSFLQYNVRIGEDYEGWKRIFKTANDK